MQFPHGVTADDVLAAVEPLLPALLSAVRIPGMEKDDLAQEARLMALQGARRYDPRPGPDGVPTRPLQNFLYRHCQNRLRNLHRDRAGQRTDPPCRDCHAGRDHDRTAKCDHYGRWAERQRRKKAILAPGRIDFADEDDTPLPPSLSAAEDAKTAELERKIDAALPVELRAFYLQLRAGLPLPKHHRDLVQEAVADILTGADAEPEFI